MFLGEWFWMVLGDIQCFAAFSSYGEIHCIKFKGGGQIWGVFLVSRNNDAKVPLKKITKFLDNSTYKVSF